MIAMTAERYIAILHPYAYTTQVTKRRLLIFVCFTAVVHSIATAFPARYDNKLVRIYPSMVGLLTPTFIAFSYTRIYLIVRRLARSANRPHDPASGGNGTRRKAFQQEIKQAKSCFIVVICFFTLTFLPALAAQAFFQNISKFESVAIFFLLISLGHSTSIVDSVIFFWTRTMLRKEAAKMLRTMQQS